MKKSAHSLKSLTGLIARWKLIKTNYKTIIERYPRTSLIAMLILMAASAMLSFTSLRRNGEKKAEAPKFSSHPGLEIPANAGLLLEVFSLQSSLKTFIDKKLPTAKDSVEMEAIIKRIEALNQKIKNHEKN